MKMIEHSAVAWFLFICLGFLGKQLRGQAVSGAIRIMGSKSRLPGLKFFLCHLLVLQP